MSKSVNFRVTNASPQSERRAVLKAGTYHQFATSEADAVGGRYAAQSKARVVGSASFEYPALPVSSPWANDPVPPEAPLGVDINAVEPVGTHAEIEHSLQLAEPQGLPGGGGVPRGGHSTPRRSSPRRRSSKRSKG